MRSEVRAVLVVFSVIAAAMVHASPVLAQSADLVLCDRIAADPNDPDKPADVAGVATIAKPDIKTAIKFCKSASPHARRAIYQLGRAYAANGQTGEAIQTYKQAIAKGSSAAMVELGVMVGTGAGVPKDRNEARALFERAAKAGNARAAINLAALNGGASDPAQSRAIYATAAAGNSPDAQFQLGMMMADGNGGPKDDTGARAMFEKAAAQGNVEAMVWAGAFAEIGRGGPQDKERAKSYFSKAAALGNQEAKQRLKNIECPYVLKDKAGKIITHLCP